MNIQEMMTRGPQSGRTTTAIRDAIARALAQDIDLTIMVCSIMACDYTMKIIVDMLKAAKIEYKLKRSREVQLFNGKWIRLCSALAEHHFQGLDHEVLIDHAVDELSLEVAERCREYKALSEMRRR